MGGNDPDSPAPDDRGAAVRADGPANTGPAVSDVASEPSERPRIPAELGEAAVAVARVDGIKPTVAALKLKHDDLQRRLPGGAARQGGRAPAPLSEVRQRYRGRQVREPGVVLLRELIAQSPALSRRRLSVKVSGAWRCVQPTGQPRDGVGRSLLLAHRAGQIELPAQRRAPPHNAIAHRRAAAGHARSGKARADSRGGNRRRGRLGFRRRSPSAVGPKVLPPTTGFRPSADFRLFSAEPAGDLALWAFFRGRAERRKSGWPTS